MKVKAEEVEVGGGRGAKKRINNSGSNNNNQRRRTTSMLEQGSCAEKQRITERIPTKTTAATQTTMMTSM